jgi:hypothetical protein
MDKEALRRIILGLHHEQPATGWQFTGMRLAIRRNVRAMTTLLEPGFEERNRCNSRLPACV